MKHTTPATTGSAPGTQGGALNTPARRSRVKDTATALLVVATVLAGALGPMQAGDRQVGLAQGRTGDGEGVDRIRLATHAASPASAGHELGRDAHDLFARGQEEALQRDGDVSAVLEGKAPLRTQ